ncbi:MAG: hypothetical protein PSV13_19920 [Lacunisphaera sp.]|nr:hypothetical protein [Lacunisphaera sp.]
MSLIWHIVQKDFRRLWLPLTLWLVLLLAHTALLAMKADPNASAASYEGLYYFANTCGVIVAAVGFILAAWIVMEDSLVDTSAFWVTRPISGARLLAAKALGAFLLLSVLPALVLTPVWLGCGFSFREIWLSAVDLALLQGVLSVLAFMLAGLTATSGQFLVRAIGAVIILPVYLTYVLGRFTGAKTGISDGVVESRNWLVLALFVLTPVALIAHQFLTRRTLRSAALGAVSLLLMLAVALAWPWDFSPQFLRFAQRNMLIPDPRNQQVVLQIECLTGPAVPPIGSWRIKRVDVGAGVPAGTFVRVDSIEGRWGKAGEPESAEPFKVDYRRPGRISPQVVRQLVGLPLPADTPVNPLIGGEEAIAPPAWARTGGLTLQGEISAALMQGRVLGELPLRVGAELRVGSSFTRVISIEQVDGRMLVRLEERDAWPALALGYYSRSKVSVLHKTRPAEDAFVLLNRPLAHDQILGVTDIGTVRINSIMVGQRQLSVTPPTREVDGLAEVIPGWADGAVIAKVRFLPGHNFVRTVAASSGLEP